MKRIANRPRGMLTLLCQDCGTPYEYFNHEVNADAPSCPTCGCSRYEYQNGLNYTSAFHSKLTMSKTERKRYADYYESLALALRYKYKTDTITADDIRKAAGHRIEKDI